MIQILLTIALSIVLIILLIDVILWAAWRPKPPRTVELAENLPFVSILIAARNEEEHIGQTLNSLLSQEYPMDKIEILVGDDSSEDTTAAIVKSFQEKHPNIHYYLIEQPKDKHKAKAGVLEVIGEKAKGEFMLFTDADIKLPSTWLPKHLACLKDEVAIQSGFTIIQRTGFFSSMQMIDWSFALGMVKILSGWKLPITAVGNNMLIKSDAYRKTGGYKDLPYSVTEDFNFFQKVVKQGFGFQQLANAGTLAISQPQTNFKSLLEQRKRWMIGAMQLPFLMKLLLFFQAAYYPAILLLLFINPLVGIPLFGLKTTLQSLFISKIHERLEEYVPLGHMFIFEFYSAILTTILCVYYLLPLPLKWKERDINQ